MTANPVDVSALITEKLGTLTTIQSSGDVPPSLRVTLPHTWPDGDSLMLFVYPAPGEQWVVTDDGETATRLGWAGMSDEEAQTMVAEACGSPFGSPSGEGSVCMAVSTPQNVPLAIVRVASVCLSLARVRWSRS